MPHFTKANAKEYARRSHAETSSRDNAVHRMRTDTQAKQLQLRMAKLALDPATPGHIAAQCARTWKELQVTRMDMGGIGKPKPVPARNEPKLKSIRKASAEPTELP